MLNGIDPIIIFEFSKLAKDADAADVKNGGVPIAATAGTLLSKLPLPFIPIYLSEKLTGIYIDTEDKIMDVDTTMETGVIGAAGTRINQRGITNNIKIAMKASKDSIGLTIMSALCDLVFPIVTSKEYAITYLHGATTVFSGFIKNFTITQNVNDSLYTIVLELIKPGLLKAVIVQPVDGKPNTVFDSVGKAAPK